MDGTEICADLKRDEEVGQVPVLMMSALTGAEKTCKRAGADGFISKPFDMADLLKTIDNVLNQKTNS